MAGRHTHSSRVWNVRHDRARARESLAEPLWERGGAGGWVALAAKDARLRRGLSLSSLTFKNRNVRKPEDGDEGKPFSQRAEPPPSFPLSSRRPLCFFLRRQAIRAHWFVLNSEWLVLLAGGLAGCMCAHLPRPARRAWHDVDVASLVDHDGGQKGQKE